MTLPAPPSDPLHVSAGILVRNGTVLACQRRADQSHPGKWEFPGGKREAGETLAACLRRELREELAIEVTAARQVWRAQHAYAGGPAVEVVFFVVEAFTGEPVNRFFADLRWVALDALARLDLLDADRALVARLPNLLAPHR